MNEQNSMLESELRDWLRNTWGRGGHGLSWLEPNSGSSVGVPDVMIPLYPRLIPVELKINKQKKTAKWFKTPVRPAQIRYHQTMAEDRLFSAYLIGHGEKDKFDVYLMPGYVKIWEPREKVGWYLVGTNQTRQGMENREKLKSLLREIEREFYPIDKDGNQVMPW